MAEFLFNTSFVQRSHGHSSISAAAYNAADKLHDIRRGVDEDYTRKQKVNDTQILLPENIKPEYKQLLENIHKSKSDSDKKNNLSALREKLWNDIELVEDSINSKRNSAIVAKDFWIGIPRELSVEQGKLLVQEYCIENFVRHGLACDVAYHKMDEGEINPHAHILVSTRMLNETGFDKKKSPYVLGQADINGDRVLLEKWRASWASIANKYLEMQGLKERIDHRSYEERGIDLVPQLKQGRRLTIVKNDCVKKGKKVLNNINEFIKKDNEWITIKHKELLLNDALMKKYSEQILSYMKELKELKNEKSKLELANGSKDEISVLREQLINGNEYLVKVQQLFDKIKTSSNASTLESQKLIMLKQRQVQDIKNSLTKIESDMVKINSLHDEYFTVKNRIKDLQEKRKGCGVFDVKEKKVIDGNIKSNEEWIKETEKLFNNTYGLDISSFENVQIAMSQKRKFMAELSEQKKQLEIIVDKSTENSRIAYEQQQKAEKGQIKHIDKKPVSVPKILADDKKYPEINGVELGIKNNKLLNSVKEQLEQAPDQEKKLCQKYIANFENVKPIQRTVEGNYKYSKFITDIKMNHYYYNEDEKVLVKALEMTFEAERIQIKLGAIKRDIRARISSLASIQESMKILNKQIEVTQLELNKCGLLDGYKKKELDDKIISLNAEMEKEKEFLNAEGFTIVQIPEAILEYKKCLDIAENIRSRTERIGSNLIENADNIQMKYFKGISKQISYPEKENIIEPYIRTRESDN